MAFDLLIINLLTVGLLGILCGSIYTWGQVLFRWLKGYEILEKTFASDRLPIPHLAVALASGWVTLNIATQFLVVLSPDSTQTVFDPNRVLAGAQMQNILSLIVGLAIWGALTISVQDQSDLTLLGFRRNGELTQLVDGLRGFLAAIVPVYLVMLLTLPLRSEETTHPLLRLLDARGIGNEFVVVAVAAAVIAPLLEELVFRVILQSALVNSCGLRGGLIVTAIIFAGVHGFPDMVALFPLALLLGIVYHWRRSYLTVVVMHALFNGLNLMLVLFQRYAADVLEDQMWMQ